ncbi:MAG: hypothetical protein GW917_02990 [Bdellovibrionales bacterium]|nr:hypothetical protein [Bdellovibrionales bacterium]
MDLSSVKDQLYDQFKELSERVQESSIYVELKERFDLLPSRIQKLILVGSGLLFALFLISFPYANISDSQSYEAQFEESRELIRDLLRASTTLKQTSPLPSASSASAVESQIRRVIDELRLGSEQVGNIQVISNASTRLASKAVNQEAVSVQLKTLNLRQVTEAAHRLQNLGSGIQPISMQMTRSDGKTHYFDVIFRIFQFSLNVTSDDPKSKSPRGGR